MASKNIEFEVPVDPEVLTNLLEAVPEDWYGVEGILRPDIEMVQSGRILPNTGFGIMNRPGEYGWGYPVFFNVQDVAYEDVVGREGPKRRRTKPKKPLGEILFGNKLPSSIEFREIEKREEFLRAREIAIRAVRYHYKGHLLFYKYENLVNSSLVLTQYIADPKRGEQFLGVLLEQFLEGRTDDSFIERLNEQIQRVRDARREGYKTVETLNANYDEGLGGKYEDVQPIVQKAIDLGIKVLE
jgi:hypothetical protein